ncbi:hypothetical protein D3C75_435390 [compost metagenome]
MMYYLTGIRTSKINTRVSNFFTIELPSSFLFFLRFDDSRKTLTEKIINCVPVIIQNPIPVFMIKRQ